MATVLASPLATPPAAAQRRPDHGFIHLLAWLSLLWERAWPALWPVTAGVLGFAVFALFDLPSLLPGWLHLILLLGFIGGMGWAASRVVRGLRLPAPGASSRRLERDSGLAHRPLATLADRPAAGDAVALAVWDVHQARIAASIRHLRLKWPDASLLAVDPRGLRAGLGLLVIVDHGEGYMSLYGHNDRLLKAVGDPVTPGEAVAAAGDTGGRASPELYFEIRRAGKPVDLAPWFRTSNPSP